MRIFMLRILWNWKYYVTRMRINNNIQWKRPLEGSPSGWFFSDSSHASVRNASQMCEQQSLCQNLDSKKLYHRPSTSTLLLSSFDSSRHCLCFFYFGSRLLLMLLLLWEPWARTGYNPKQKKREILCSLLVSRKKEHVLLTWTPTLVNSFWGFCLPRFLGLFFGSLVGSLCIRFVYLEALCAVRIWGWHSITV